MPKPSNSALHDAVREAPSIAESTRNKYLRDLNQWIAFAGTNPKAWTKTKLNAFRRVLLSRMQEASAERLLSSVQFAVMQWANRTGKPNFGTRTEAILDEESANKLLNSCDATPPGRRDFALIVIGLETGMRRTQLAALDIEQLDDKIPSAVALQAAKQWLRWLGRKHGPLFRPLTRRIKSPTAFEWSAAERGMTESAIQKMLAERGTQAGIGPVHPKMFHPTFIAWRLAAGYSTVQISTFMAIESGAAQITSDRLKFEQMRYSTPPWLAELVARRS